MAEAPRTLQRIPDSFRRWATTARQPASTAPDPDEQAEFAEAGAAHPLPVGRPAMLGRLFTDRADDPEQERSGFYALSASGRPNPGIMSARPRTNRTGVSTFG